MKNSNCPGFLKGIDLSCWQGVIDWQVVKNSGCVDFAMVKATEGATGQDPKFQANWRAMKQHEIPMMGAYHFFRGTSTPAEQANNLMAQLDQVGFNHTTDLLAIDVEKSDQLTPTEVANHVQLLLTYLTSPKINQEKVFIYTSPEWWNSHVADVSEPLSKQPLWVAYWTEASLASLPNGWSDWKIWQYTHQGVVPGIRGDVDLNRMKKSLSHSGTAASCDTLIANTITAVGP